MGKFRNFINKIPFLDGFRLSLLAGICHHGMNFFHDSYSVTKVISSGAKEYVDGDKPAIFAVYHGRLVGLLNIMPDRSRMSILISDSRDGEIIARGLNAIGFNITRGSSARGAVRGTLQTLKAAKTDQYLIVVVDGPRGPRQGVKPGIIKLSELTGLPIIPFTCDAREKTFAWGWDRFLLPPWGTEEVLFYGNPIRVQEGAGEAELEAYRQTLVDDLLDLDKHCKRFFAVTALTG